MSHKNTIALEDFNGLKATVEMEKVMKKYGRLSRDDLKSNPSRDPRIKKHRKKNEYFSTWQYRYDKGRKTAVVYNKKNGRLTYLLENGHAITNARGGIKWTRPFPHIELTYEKFKDKYVQDMRNTDIDVEFT